MSDKLKNIIRERIKKIMEDSSTGTGGATFFTGDGAQSAPKYSFKKGTNKKGVKNPYYYKLGWKPVPDKIKGSGLEVKKLFEEDLPASKSFQQDQMIALKQIENLINQLPEVVSNAKNDLAQYYNSHPESFEVKYSPKLALKFLQDAITLLKGKEE